MDERKFFYIFFLFVFCLIPRQINGQTAFDLTFEEKLKSLSVDSLTLEEKIAFLLLPRGNNISDQFSEKESSFNNPVIPANKVLNAINGFQDERTIFPFPDVRAINNVRDPKLLDILKLDLLSFSSQEEFRFILASDQYLFSNVGFPWVSIPHEYDYALWVLSGNNGEALRIPALMMPHLLFEKNEPLSRLQNHSSKETFNSWIKKDVESSLASFENKVADGVVFLSNDPAADHSRLVRAYRNKMLMEEDLNQGCRKVLKALREVKSVYVREKQTSLPLSKLARWLSFEQGIRFFHKSNQPFLPADLTDVTAGIWSDTGDESTHVFTNMLKFHIPVVDSDTMEISHAFWLADGDLLTDSLVKAGIEKIRNHHPNAKVAIITASPGEYFKTRAFPEGVDALFCGTSDYPIVWKFLAQGVAGGLNIRYTPTHETWFSGIKQFTRDLQQTRLKFGIPGEVAMHGDSLLKIDSIMAEAIRSKATPGGQVLVARDGVIVWNKNYGYHTYDKKRSVESQHLYDIASVTKIAATIPSLMKLYEKGLWTMADSLVLFFPQTDTTEKSGITIKELLLHESGLSAFIPFYQNTIDKDKLNGGLFGRRYSWLYNIKLDNYIYLNRTVSYRKDVFQKTGDDVFNVPVAQNYFMNEFYLDSIMNQVIESPMRTRHRYLYSDLGFYFLGQMIPRLTGEFMDKYMDSNFYQPLGMHRSSFLPVRSFPLEEIVPTEQDKAFRKQLIHGWVHDPGAAMMGGVAGHAGLFANAVDMAKLMQMYLNKGTYGDFRYLDENTIEFFTSCHSENNRRGLGFDKPETDTTKMSPVSLYASPTSFGHSGFTGTLVWADPESELVYVFLSNRVHPHQYNKTLIQENFRTRIQDVIYRAIINPEKR
jgi:CubicO group peptidase (beta-lactamase class C family)